MASGTQLAVQSRLQKKQVFEEFFLIFIVHYYINTVGYIFYCTFYYVKKVQYILQFIFFTEIL